MNRYLIEIGTEELPHKFISSALAQLKKGFETLLNDNNVEYSQIVEYATPRRLTLIIEGLSEKQEDVEKVVKGPIAKIAFAADGSLSPAGLGFAKKNGVGEKELFVEDDYVFAKVFQKGKLTKDLLSDNVEAIVLKLQGSHFMRWANLEVKFQRPVRWVVSLFNSDELPVTIATVQSSRFSRGHRFKSDKVEIKSPEAYVSALRENNVLASQAERKETIIKLSKIEAEKIGADVVFDDELVDEVCNLTEYPIPVVCDFKESYLDIPEKVNVTVMASHQRYFPLYKNGKLINKFITITNFIGNEFSNIKAGNERVVTARLEDGLFFFKQDTKTPLEAKLETLKGVTFQKGMGTMFDKTQRIKALSSHILADLGLSSADVLRTAELCKCDLVTSLVFEFTELQGFIGADYARLSGENSKVIKGIEEHYFPLGSDSDLASGIEGQVVGIADKIDTVCAVFADGKKPTGSADPLGIRRAVLGILKTLINCDLKIDLEKLIETSVSLLPVKSSDEKTLLAEIKDFFIQRLVILYSEKYSHDVIEACVSNKNVLSDLSDFVVRVELVSQMVKTEDYAKFHEAANRIIRILKSDVQSELPNRALFVSQSEVQLWDCASAIDETKLDYSELCEKLVVSIGIIEGFFENVLVMDEDAKIKNNRLALLQAVRNKFDKIADFSKIVR